MVEISRDDEVIPRQYSDIQALADDFNGSRLEEIQGYILTLPGQVFWTAEQAKMVSASVGLSFLSGN